MASRWAFRCRFPGERPLAADKTIRWRWPGMALKGRTRRLDRRVPSVRYRRFPVVAGYSGEGRFTEPTAAARLGRGNGSRFRTTIIGTVFVESTT